MPFRLLVDFGVIFECVLHLVHLVKTQVRVGRLATLENQGDFEAVAGFEELLRFANLGLEVMDVRAQAQADPFHLVTLLFRLLLLFELLLFIEVFPEVHDLAHRRVHVRSDFDQVLAGVRRESFRFLNPLDAQGFSLLINEADGGDANLIVDAERFRADTKDSKSRKRRNSALKACAFYEKAPGGVKLKTAHSLRGL